MSEKFSKGFEYDDFDDPVDLVLATDMDIDMAIEKAEEMADTMESDDLIKTMKENGDLCCEVDEDEEAMMYDEDEDDAMDIADVDGQDYREAFDIEEEEDMEEDEEIDTVIDCDPEAECEDLEDADIR